MATSEMSLFPSVALNLQAIHEHESDDESDDEEERQQREGLEEDLKHAFDGLSEDESCNDNSRGYYGEIGESSLVNPDRNMQNGIHSPDTDNANEMSQNYLNNEGLNNHHIGTVWSDISDQSGNFSRQKSIIETSPTRFQINMQGIVSQSEESEIENPDTTSYCDTGNGNMNERDNYLRQIDQNEYLSAETTDSQLKLLYDARGRELDKLSEELEELKKDSSEQISNLRHEVGILRTEKVSVESSINNMKILLSENEGRMRSLLADLKEREKKVEILEKENKKLKMEVNIAEGTISNLEQHISVLQNVASIAKSRQAQEDFLKKLKNSHDEQLDELNRRLKSVSSKAEGYEQEVNILQEELRVLRKSKENSLKEKSEIIRDLTSSYEDAKRQIQVLLSKKPNLTSEHEISSKNELLLELQKVTNELKEAKSNLKSYDMLAKLGFFQSVASPEDSVDQLNLRKALTFEENVSVPRVPSNKNEKSDPKNIEENLKTQFYQILYKNKKLRDELQGLNEILTQKDEQIKIAQSELKSLKEDAKHPINSSMKLSQNHVILEENTHLKKELLCFFEHFDKISENGEKMTGELCSFLNKNQLSSSAPAVDLNSQIHSLRTVIQNFGDIIQKFGKFHYATWEELKDENIQLKSKRMTVIDNIITLIDSLKNMQNDLKLKNIDNSSYAISLKSLLDTFIVNSKLLKDEVEEYFSISIQLNNELHSVRLSLERTRRENEELKSTIKLFEENEKKNEAKRNQMLESCKEEYLKSHENVISKMKSEYETLIISCKKEVDSLSCRLAEMQEKYEKLQCEKITLEGVCNIENIKEKDLIIETLQRNLAESVEKIRDIENKYKIKIEDLVSKLNVPNNNDNLSISENVTLYEIREKNKQLLIENQKLKEVIKLKSDNGRENNPSEDLSRFLIHLNERGLNEISDTDFGGFKKLYEDQKINNEKLKYSHEKELEKLKIQLTNTVVSKKDEEIKLLKENISELMSKLNSLKENSESKLNDIMKEHSLILINSTQKIADLTNKIKQLDLEREVLVTDFNKYMSESNMEKHQYQKKAQDLAQVYTSRKVKYDELKNKYRAFQNKEIAREKKLIGDVSERLQDMRSYLEKRIRRVINELKDYPQNSMPRSTLKFHIDELEEICNSLVKVIHIDFGEKS